MKDKPLKNKIFAALLLPQIWSQGSQTEGTAGSIHSRGLLRLSAPLGTLNQASSSYVAPWIVSGVEFLGQFKSSFGFNLGAGFELLSQNEIFMDSSRKSFAVFGIGEFPVELSSRFEFISRMDLGVGIVPEFFNQRSEQNFFMRISPSLKFQDRRLANLVFEVGPEIQVLRSYNLRGAIRIGYSL